MASCSLCSAFCSSSRPVSLLLALTFCLIPRTIAGTGWASWLVRLQVHISTSTPPTTFSAGRGESTGSSVKKRCNHSTNLTWPPLYRMTGFFQTSFYFGYTGLVCLGMFCLLGKSQRFPNYITSQCLNKLVRYYRRRRPLGDFTICTQDIPECEDWLDIIVFSIFIHYYICFFHYC